MGLLSLDTVAASLPPPGTTNGGGAGILDIFDPSGTRLKFAGLFSGGATASQSAGSLGYNINSANDNSTDPGMGDWRVRISLPKASSLFYRTAGQLQNVLARTNGVVFPYTPTVTVTHNARYQEQALTHSNYKNYFYEGSDVGAITISGDFTVQNLDEGQYLLAAIYFFRTCTKMFFGEKENSKNAGNPPPIVYLDGYGTFYLPHVSCVVTSFSHTMPDNVDYLEIPSTTGTSQSTGKNPTPSTGTTRLPTSSQIQVTLQPVYSRKNIYEKFTLSSFASGALLGSSSGSSNTSGFL